MPQVVDPAQPPMNIMKKKIGRAKLPQRLKSEVAYPVPVIIDTILNDAKRSDEIGSSPFFSQSQPAAIITITLTSDRKHCT